MEGKSNVPIIAPAKGMRSFEFKQSRYKHLDGFCPCRNITCGSSGSGKGVLLQSLVLDVFRDVMERWYIIGPTVNSDHTWEPVKKYLRKTRKIPEEEQLFFESFDPDVVNSIIEKQKSIIEFEKKTTSNNFTKSHS